MGPDSTTDLKDDFQAQAGIHILRLTNILCLDYVYRYLSDRFKKITLVESGHVVNSMKKDENQRETKKRRNGGQKSRERMETVKNHIHNLAMAYMKANSPRRLAASFTMIEINEAIHGDVINFFEENPELPQSKKLLLNPDNSPKDDPDATRAIADKLSLLRKEGRLRPFFEPLTPDQ